MTPVVLLDCDGVLSDFCGGFLKLVNAHFGTAVVPDDVWTYDIGEALGWSPARTEEAYSLITASPDFAARLDVLPGAVDGVRRLAEAAEVFVVTSPWHTQPTWHHDRTNWLHRNFGIPASHIVHASAKHLVAGDVLIDDKTTTCATWRKRWPRSVAVRWETPHNLREWWDGPSTRSWDDVLKIVAQVERARSATP